MADTPVQVSYGDGPRGKLVKLDKPIFGCSIIEFTGHACARMEERDVSEEDILKTIIADVHVSGQKPPERIRVRWNKTRSKRIDVVYEKRKNKLLIITVIPFGGGTLR